MTDKHDDAGLLEGIEAVVDRLGGLELALGPSVRPLLSFVRDRLIAAMAARDRGDLPAAISCIGTAMDELAAYAGRLDPCEAGTMRDASQALQRALLRGDASAAKESAAVMFNRSGAVERKRAR